MGYVSMTTDTLYELFRRWQAGQKSREIAIGLNLDRKTVRKYVQALAASELVDARGPDFETALPVLSKILEDRNRRRSKEAFAELRTYAEQIRSYLNDPQAPLKPKSVYQVLVQKHDLGASYSTFKRFMRTLEVKTSPPLRIEWPPGQRSELDYGVVGAHEDAGSGKKRRVHAFCNVMAMSRLPFVEFVYTQTEVSFVESNVHMCEFYGGVTQSDGSSASGSISRLRCGMSWKPLECIMKSWRIIWLHKVIRYRSSCLKRSRRMPLVWTSNPRPTIGMRRC
jgi:hypothetical protein